MIWIDIVIITLEQFRAIWTVQLLNCRKFIYEMYIYLNYNSFTKTWINLTLAIIITSVTIVTNNNVINNTFTTQAQSIANSLVLSARTIYFLNVW